MDFYRFMGNLIARKYSGCTQGSYRKYAGCTEIYKMSKTKHSL